MSVESRQNIKNTGTFLSGLQKNFKYLNHNQLLFYSRECLLKNCAILVSDERIFLKFRHFLP